MLDGGYQFLFGFNWTNGKRGGAIIRKSEGEKSFSIQLKNFPTAAWELTVWTVDCRNVTFVQCNGRKGKTIPSFSSRSGVVVVNEWRFIRFVSNFQDGVKDGIPCGGK